MAVYTNEEAFERDAAAKHIELKQYIGGEWPAAPVFETSPAEEQTGRIGLNIRSGDDHVLVGGPFNSVAVSHPEDCRAFGYVMCTHANPSHTVFYGEIAEGDDTFDPQEQHMIAEDIPYELEGILVITRFIYG